MPVTELGQHVQRPDTPDSRLDALPTDVVNAADRG